MLVEVAVAAAVRGTFTYRVPASLEPEVTLGRRVAVPFGRSPRATGYVLGFPESAPDGVALRDVAAVLDQFPLFTAPLVKLLRWAEDYYLVPPGELFRAALPPGLNARGGGEAPARRAVEFAAPCDGAAGALDGLGRAPAQRAVLEYLLARGRIPLEELRAALPKARPALTALVKRGLARVEAEAPAPAGAELPASAAAPALTPAQAAALAAVEEAAGAYTPFLLLGVTGSGKTEVYLQAIARARARGKGALVLVPEIGLTPQLAGRFRARFGADVAVLHSGLTPPERHAEWLRLRRGEARICVGVRSAIFAPVEDVGVIVVDEEHDGSFKQEDGPAYHARDLAVVRARLEQAVLLLGSATPSLETLENARRGRYRLLELPERVDGRPMPEVEVVDLSRRRGGGRGAARPELGLLSPRLAEMLRETLAAGQQSILFLNRRGYETLVVCEDCGREEQCERCSVSLTHHRRRNVLTCHYCGYSVPVTPECPACGGMRRGLGVGTEQVEAGVKALLPGARVERLDRDAVSGADDLASVLARFARRELDVLVGTQMVAKGHDFPGVTLVGVVLADTSLALPDFRARERTFQLLAQVAGRAGRGGEAGRVLVQTFHPEEPAIDCARTHDYARFAEGELAWRRQLAYPPHGRMMAVRVEGSEAGARRTAEALGQAARPALGRAMMLGPAPAALERLRGKSRWHLLFKAPDAASLRPVHRALARVAARPPGGAAVRFDMDPYSML
ncbi:replication restart helicase PriA [Anaeromyxobacter paludicola]|uniref:Replication restart protein PriA n=1 Tax=Anaeromyxobacter paludicola TaxID=2918171 RepID=A0ABM7XEX2_9BACT|nr:primosomal protein N' [Anaeromyxobacter paludicola]BDG10448.1 primosomal protein N' [Anaeromyxobacter paludicola]